MSEKTAEEHYTEGFDAGARDASRAAVSEIDALKVEVEAERLHTNNALAEVRRLSELNAELIVALRAVEKVAAGFHDIEGVTYAEAEALFDKIRAALAKAGAK